MDEACRMPSKVLLSPCLAFALTVGLKIEGLSWTLKVQQSKANDFCQKEAMGSCNFKSLDSQEEAV